MTEQDKVKLAGTGGVLAGFNAAAVFYGLLNDTSGFILVLQTLGVCGGALLVATALGWIRESDNAP